MIAVNNFSKLLQDIKDDPVKYLGKPSITSLHLFLIGYLDTLYNLTATREGSVMKGFQEWIQEREKTTISRSWDATLLFVIGTEKLAFYAFFDLFDKFLKNASKSEEIDFEQELKFNKDNLKPQLFDVYNELLGSIKKRPGMYLGTASITRLDMLLRGYSLARREVGTPATEPEKEFEGFQEWLQEKYGIKTGQSWSKIILFHSIDEPEALAKFFELYKEYLNQNLEVEESSSK